MKERDCENCKHHTEDGCSSWDCEFEKAMTKQEAIKWIIYEKDSIDTEGYCATKENYARIQALDMAIEALSSDAVHIDIYRELYEKYVELKHESAEAEWIPCSERLPNDAKDVLVCMRNGWIYMASYRHNRRLWKFYADGYADCEIVIAWMPLPTPYKGGDDE